MSLFMFWLVMIIMVIGALGTLVPVIPGTPLIFLAALGYGFYEGFQRVTPGLLLILFSLMLIAFAIEYFSGVIGAKKYGATKYGSWGAFIGGVFGVILFNIPGLVVGPFLGAVIGEVISGKQINPALKVGFGTFVGMAGGAILELIIACSMISLYLSYVT